MESSIRRVFGIRYYKFIFTLFQKVTIPQMDVTERNVAYIDGSNLHHGIKKLPWKFNYARFRVWLSDKYDDEHAYLFLGMMAIYKELYNYLQECGFTLIFKEVIFHGSGKAEGNRDSDIVVHAMQNAYENKYNKAVIVSSDGDYVPLVKFLMEKEKLEVILSPHETQRCSILLKRTNARIAYIGDQESTLGE